MKSKVIFQKEKIVIVCMFFAILLIAFFTSTFHDLPVIFNDEFGYWDSAAWMAGFNWSGAASAIQYYSYGYGIILSVLIRLAVSTTQAYHYAIFLNSLWIALSFIILYRICGKLYHDLKFSYRISFSLVATLFASNITQRNYTWPECFLYFLFCVNAYLIILLCEKATFIRIVGLAFLCIFSYTIHQRTIAITLANMVIVFLLLISKKINKKWMVGFIVLFFLFLFAHVSLKNVVLEAVWNNSLSSNVNNMESQIDKLNFLFSTDGIKIFVLTFLGRIFYVAISSILLCFFAAERIGKNIINNWKIHKVDYINIFLFCSIFFTVGISTASMYTSDFSDVSHIVYGRYIDNIMGPFIIIGLYEIFNTKKSLKEWFIYGDFLVILGLAVSLLWEMKHPQWISDINNSGMAVWVSDKEIRVWPSIIITFIISSLIYYIGHGLIKKIEWSLECICIVFIFIWGLNGQTARNNFDNENIGIHDSTIQCADVISGLQRKFDGNISIYADQILEPMGKWVNYSANGIQFLLPEEEIRYINLTSELDLLEGECVVLTPIGYEVPDTLKMIFSTNNYNLYTLENSNVCKFAEEMIE